MGMESSSGSPPRDLPALNQASLSLFSLGGEGTPTSGSRHWVESRVRVEGRRTGPWAQAPLGVYLCADTRTNKRVLTALCWVLEAGPAMFPWQHHQTVGDRVSREWEGWQSLVAPEPGKTSPRMGPECSGGAQARPVMM